MHEHLIVVGLGYGDEGKGTIVDHLCGPFGGRRGGHKPAAVVRFNGGAQAAHHVVQADGKEHRFAQIGSGAFHGVPTFLSRYMMVNPSAFIWEYKALQDMGVAPLTYVDPEALVTTPYHIEVNRHKAQRDGHGSCLGGIGATALFAILYPQDALRVKHLVHEIDTVPYVGKLEDWCNSITKKQPPKVPWKDFREFLTMVEVPNEPGEMTLRRFCRTGPVIFEGAQGVMLDEDFGFHPYTTWSKTTPTNARILLEEARQIASVRTIGVTRTYTTRHGPGPMPTENKDILHPEAHNTAGEFTGDMRQGALDIAGLEYAAKACGGIDEIALTHCDKSTRGMGIAYKINGHLWVPKLPESLEDQKALTVQMERAEPQWGLAGYNAATYLSAIAPITIRSLGPKTNDKMGIEP